VQRPICDFDVFSQIASMEKGMSKGKCFCFDRESDNFHEDPRTFYCYWGHKFTTNALLCKTPCTRTLISNKCTKSFFIYCNTLLHVSTLLGHLQGELSVVVTLRLHHTVERECAVDCALRCFGGVNCLRSRLVKPRPQRIHASNTQYTVNSTFSLNCIVQP
jgi:hypothetical protein